MPQIVYTQEPRPQALQIPIIHTTKIPAHWMRKTPASSHHIPRLRFSLPAFFLLLFICTASLFFPLSAAFLFLPQGFCTDKVFNEVCPLSVYHSALCHCPVHRPCRPVSVPTLCIGITVEWVCWSNKLGPLIRGGFGICNHVM